MNDKISLIVLGVIALVIFLGGGYYIHQRIKRFEDYKDQEMKECVEQCKHDGGKITICKLTCKKLVYNF